MRISTGIRNEFGHFHNLNLLALIEDLRRDQMAREDWTSTGKLLCPVAHGLASGQEVRQVNVLGDMANLGRACELAANSLGADVGSVIRFVRSWDDRTISTRVLLRYLEEIWGERLADAVAVQQVLEGSMPAALV
jgi:hypothetical protein